MFLREKKLLIKCADAKPISPGCITYLDASSVTLLQRYGWLVASDTSDETVERISHDNGRTWSEPKTRYRKQRTDNGEVRFAESTAYLDSGTNRLHTLTSKLLYPNAAHGTFEVASLKRTTEFQSLDNHAGRWSDPVELDFGTDKGLGLSFCFPIKTSSGKILVPACQNRVNDEGATIRYPIADGASHIVCDTVTLIGTYDETGNLRFQPGNPLQISIDRSTRGLSENTLCEIRPGEIGQVARGSNAGRAETMRGHKWVSWSSDDGMNWSRPTELLFDDGESVPSSATGCAVFRSPTTGKVYFIGNIADSFEQVDGNYPRTPLAIAEIDESSFAVKRSTLTVIDERAPGESEHVQMSNFRFYQDRQTGDVVVYLSRYGERGGHANWRDADFYEHRVCLS